MPSFNVHKIHVLHNVEMLSLRTIAKMFGTSHGILSKLLRNHDYPVRQRVHSLDESYFEVLDTCSKFYWIGLLYSDGCLTEVKETRTFRIRIKLQERDKEILYQFKKALNTTAPLKIEKDKKRRIYNYIEVYSKKMFFDLRKYGLQPNKTHILNFPLDIFEANEVFLQNFIRGVFDGDGTINERKLNKTPTFSITGTYNLLVGIQNVLVTYVGLRRNKIRKQKNSYVLSYSGPHNIQKIFSWLYKDIGNVPFLARKYEKFNEILSTPKYPKKYLLYRCPNCEKYFFHEKRLVYQLKKYTFKSRFCSLNCSGKFSRDFQLNGKLVSKDMKKKLENNIISEHVIFNYIGVKK